MPPEMGGPHDLGPQAMHDFTGTDKRPKLERAQSAVGPERPASVQGLLGPRTPGGPGGYHELRRAGSAQGRELRRQYSQEREGRRGRAASEGGGE